MRVPAVVLAYRSADILLRIVRGVSIGLERVQNRPPAKEDLLLLGVPLQRGFFAWRDLVFRLSPAVRDMARSVYPSAQLRKVPFDSYIDWVAGCVGWKYFSRAPWSARWDADRAMKEPELDRDIKLPLNRRSDPGARYELADRLRAIRNGFEAMGEQSDADLAQALGHDWLLVAIGSRPREIVGHYKISPAYLGDKLSSLRGERSLVLKARFGDGDRYAAQCDGPAARMIDEWAAYVSRCRTAAERIAAIHAATAEGIKSFAVIPPTAYELAEAAGVHHSAVYRLCARAGIKCPRNSRRRVVFTPDVVRRLLEVATKARVYKYRKMVNGWRKWSEIPTGAPGS